MLDNLFEQAFTAHRDMSVNSVKESLDSDFDFEAQYINDDYDGTENSDWEEVKTKRVLDSDGFWTDYTLYKGTNTDGTDIWICMFGDKDIETPDIPYADVDFDLEQNALDWFDNYVGFEDELSENHKIECDDETCCECGSKMEWDDEGFSYCPNCKESLQDFTEGVNSTYFNKFDDLLEEYLPSTGEGDNLATQATSAVNKLVYKWYNDGAIYDGTNYLEGNEDDLSSYANWLNEYIAGTGDILFEIENAETDEDYEFILKKLADFVLTEENLEALSENDKQGSIYECGGPFTFEIEEISDDETKEINESALVEEKSLADYSIDELEKELAKRTSEKYDDGRKSDYEFLISQGYSPDEAWAEIETYNYADDIDESTKVKTEAKHSYGGAYDIEDDQLFTKEELMEFAQDIIDSLVSLSDHDINSFDISDLYIDNDYLTIKLLFKPEDIEEEVTIKLDYRRAKNPRTLVKAYLEHFVDEFAEKFDKDGVRMKLTLSGQDYPLEESWSENVYNPDNMEYVRKKLEDTSAKGYKYTVEEIYIDYGADWKEYTIICYDDKRGSSWQVLYPTEIKAINNATSNAELDEIVDEIKNRKYFLDKAEKVDEAIDTGREYWYFTKHGVMPGSVPKGIDILDVVDEQDGSYFKTNKLLTTDELEEFDIKEKVPTTVENLNESSANEKCFVTEYEEYPIYEPAEGGYYYAGNEVVFSQEFNSFEEAFQYIQDNKDDYIDSDFELKDRDLDTLHEWFEEDGFVTVANRSSKYIGEGSSLVIEKKKGSQESGSHPYESVKHSKKKKIDEAYMLNDTDNVFKYDMENLAITLYNLLTDKDRDIDLTYLNGNFKGAEYILSYNGIDKKIFAAQQQNGEVKIDSGREQGLEVFGKKPSELVDAIYEYAKTFKEEDDD